MNPGTISYKISTATYGQVLDHLLKCDEYFIPKLSDKTDIAAYSAKIVQNCVIFEAWKNEELIGVIAAYFNDETGNTGFITNVSTLKEFSGKGIASTLLKQCIDHAEKNNYKEIRLEVSRSNDAAIALYKKYDFMPAEIKNDTLVMKKHINQI